MGDKNKDDRLLERGIEDSLVTDFADTHRKSYGDFLQLKTLLNLQKTLSGTSAAG